MLQLAHSPLRPPTKGTVLAERYEVIRALGSGCLGTTYLARDRELGGSRVALKLLHANLLSDEQVLAELKNRVGQIRQLSHPNICRCYDLIGLGGSSWLIAMEYVPGGSLAELLQKIRGQRLRTAEALHLSAQLLRGLQFAHQAGIVHGNLHPGNILIGRDGAVKIADFLINSAIAPELGLTRSKTMLGIPRYLAPEQISASSAQIASDIFAASVIIAELLGDVRPQSQSVVEQMSQQFELSLASFGLSSSSCAPGIAASLQQCFCSVAADRPASVDGLLAAIERELAESSLSGKATLTEIQGLSAKLFTEQDIAHFKPLRATMLFLAIAGAVFSLGQDNVKTRIMTMALVVERGSGVDFAPVYRYLGLPVVSLNRGDAIRNAIEYPKPWLISGLLRAGARYDRADATQKSPLEYIFDAAVAVGADDADNQGHKLKAANETGYSPDLTPGSSEQLLLHRSIRARALDYSHQLLNYFPQYGKVRDDQRRTALDLAAELNFRAGITQLLDADDAICSVDSETGRSAIHWAALSGANEALQELIAKRCISMLADANGKTPLHLALELAPDRDVRRTVELLLSVLASPPVLTKEFEELAVKRGVHSLFVSREAARD